MDNPYVAEENRVKQAEFDYLTICNQLEKMQRVVIVSDGLIKILLAELKYWHDRAVELYSDRDC